MAHLRISVYDLSQQRWVILHTKSSLHLHSGNFPEKFPKRSGFGLGLVFKINMFQPFVVLGQSVFSPPLSKEWLTVHNKEILVAASFPRIFPVDGVADWPGIDRLIVRKLSLCSFIPRVFPAASMRVGPASIHWLILPKPPPCSFIPRNLLVASIPLGPASIKWLIVYAREPSLLQPCSFRELSQAIGVSIGG